jgi:hypothetical protein
MIPELQHPQKAPSILTTSNLTYYYYDDVLSTYAQPLFDHTSTYLPTYLPNYLR